MEKKMENEMETGVIYRGLQGLGFPIFRGTISGCPHDKHYSILGSVLGSHYFGKLPYPKIDTITCNGPTYLSSKMLPCGVALAVAAAAFFDCVS